MLKHLGLNEMVALLSPYAGKTRRRALFLTIPEIAPLLPRVTDAHQAVVAVAPVDSTKSPALQKIEAQLLVLDARHDNLARALHACGQAERALCLAEDPPEEERAAECERLFLTLFPDGLSIINTSSLSESGNLERIEKLIQEEPGIVTFLKTIPLRGKKSAADLLTRWIAIGKELAEREDAKEAELAKTATPPSAKNVVTARNQWLKVVTLILGNLELSTVPAETMEAIRGPILRASDRAAKRYATGNPDAEVLDPETADDVAEGDSPVAPPVPTAGGKKPVG